MQIKSRPAMLRIITLFSFIITLTLASCNGDVFVDRPEKPKVIISSQGISAGESTTITITEDIPYYPEMSIYYDYQGDAEELLHTGQAESYSDDLLQLTVNVDMSALSLIMTVDRCYYPKDLTVIFSVPQINDMSATIRIYSRTLNDYEVGTITYDLSSWELEPEMVKIPVEEYSFNNDTDETFYFPIIWKGLGCEQRGKFFPDNSMTDQVLPNSSILVVPVPAINEDGIPVMTDADTVYGMFSNERGFDIPGYTLVSETVVREKVEPGQILNYQVYAEAKVYKIRYAIPLYNDYGDHITINGTLKIAVPEEFKYTHSITK